jgi:DNA-binding CsgD family transcriptional regulator
MEERAGDIELARAHFEEALAICRRVEEPRTLAMTLGWLGAFLMRRGELRRAAALLAENLEIQWRRGAKGPVLLGIETIGAAALQLGHAAFAARLHGAALAWRAQYGLPRSPLWRETYAQGEAAMRDALGDEAYADILATGRALPLDVAVEEALTFARAAAAAPEHETDAGGVAPPLNGTVRPATASALVSAEEPAPPVRDPDGTAGAQPPSASLIESLSPREVDVLRLIAAGGSNREIADELVLSVRTVERHITNLYGKIGARGKADATAYALRHGLL